MTNDHDPIRNATARTAEKLEEASEEYVSALNERDFLQPILSAALAKATACPAHQRLGTQPLPDWDRAPGGLDVFILHCGSESLMYYAELKWCSQNNVFECLYDVLKLAAVLKSSMDNPDKPLLGAYLITGASVKKWTKPVECAKYFFDGEHRIADDIRGIGHWWQKYILDDSAGLPASAPRRIKTSVVADPEMTIQGQAWQLRAVSVEIVDPTPDPFKDGSPLGPGGASE
jgi:hypothetical protein